MKAQTKPIIICLMGPTASGKTPLAIELVKRLPCDIISVDSAMVYREMDIGTAKPDAATLQIAPHRLINLLDPSVPYSAGQFRTDAMREIKDIIAHGRIPLLVGGTMMYFRVLQAGLANLPQANSQIRQALEMRAEQVGWPALHAELALVDLEAANRIHANDSQRIQRALEVYQLTGKSLTALQNEATDPLSDYHVYNFALAPATRERLHERIHLRLQQMLDQGLVEEVKHLYDRGDLSIDLPSIRSVGYRQVWEYLAGECTYEEMCAKVAAATRQLAKRQITWLRSWPDVVWLDSDSDSLPDQVIQSIS